MKQEENLILRQNDIGNEIVFIFDTNLTDITSAEFRLIKPDNTFVIITGTVEENTATFTITEQCCVIPGRCHFNLRLINSASNIYTYVSNCIIDINLNLEDAIESTAEANGYTFPDDFALKSEIPSTDDLATKEYVNDAIAQIPTYTPPDYSSTPHKTGRKWINGKDIWEVTIAVSFTGDYVSVDITDLNIDFIVPKVEGGVYDSDGGMVPIDYENSVSIYMSSRTLLNITNRFYNTRPNGYVTIYYTV